ncbi:hypothetical protein H5410_017930 [Solanum commersonii]|uniref:Uncharacterized protein n=1 Tax=Solanum commersonii TaxID=4109 RepID=A0A9J6A1D9_SOLCO|nr:hypothetical protein H5410_017930 [Solanum commersonii]
MWPHTSGVVIEPLGPNVIPGRPPKCRRKAKNEPRKKYGKLSKRGVKMTCSLCHQVGHNQKACPTMAGIGQPEGYPSMQPSLSHPPMFNQPSSSSQPPMYYYIKSHFKTFLYNLVLQEKELSLREFTRMQLSWIGLFDWSSLEQINELISPIDSENVRE